MITRYRIDDGRFESLPDSASWQFWALQATYLLAIEGREMWRGSKLLGVPEGVSEALVLSNFTGVRHTDFVVDQRLIARTSLSKKRKNPRRQAAGKRNQAVRRGLSEAGRDSLRQAARQRRPWEHSTGPRTISGKAIAAANGQKHGEKPRVQPLAQPCPDPCAEAQRGPRAEDR